MARVSRDVIRSFEAVASSSFAFLVAEEGWGGPVPGGYKVDFSSPTYRVQVFFDDSEARVSTTVFRAGTGSAGLTCLYVAAGLGPPQDIRDIARGMKQLGPVVESEALALRKLLPILEAPEGAAIMARCHLRDQVPR